MAQSKINHLDLFSGIGGFALAARNVWGERHNVVSFCDIEPFAQKVLKKHWPNVPCHDDIKTMKGTDYAGVTILTGGFPCQPFSNAGQRRGTEDDRHLWPQMLRIIQESKPEWIVGENVRGLINWNDGMVFDEVVFDLESSGYNVQPFLLPACAVDAPHRRERIWFVAHTKRDGFIAGEGRKSIKTPIREQPPRPDGTFDIEGTSDLSTATKDVADGVRIGSHRKEINTNETGVNAQRGFKGSGENVADANLERLEGETSQRIQAGKRRGNGFCYGLAPRDSWRGKRKWVPEPRVGRVANGIPNRVDRIKGLGNAIVPQVAEMIFKAIDAQMEIERGKR